MKTKNRLAHWVALLLCLLAPALARAQYNFNVNPGGTTITITGYTGPGGAVNIPSTFSGFTVTSLDRWAFLSNSLITSITIPASVTNVGDAAFANCTALTSVSIPEGVIRIGIGAFLNCGALTSVTIPNSVTSMGDLAFQTCANLGSVTIGNGLKNVPYLAFAQCVNLTNLSIGSGVTNIAESAFVQCVKLKQTTIPASVQSLGKAVFAFTGLTNIVVPGNVLTLGEQVFGGCGDLATVTIANGVQSIGDLAFFRAGIKAIHLPASVTQLGERNPFAGCLRLIDLTVDISNPAYVSVFNADSQLKHYYALFDKTQTKVITLSPGYDWGPVSGSPSFPLSVTNIGAYAFYLGGAQIQLPPNLAIIGASAFAENYSQGVFPAIFPSTVLTLDKLVSIEEAAFYRTTKFLNLRLDKCPALKSIGAEAFKRALPTNDVVIPNSVTNLGGGVFNECRYLRNVTIGNGITSLPPLAFYNCFALTNISFPSGLLIIGDGAFQNCYSLGNIVLPNTLTAMGVSAFQQCQRLTSVTIPNGLNSIPPFAFALCPVLASVTIPNSVTSIGDSAFSRCPLLTNVTIPSSVTDVGPHAFESTGLASVVIPNSVTSLGNFAFQGCGNLASIAIGSGVRVIGSNAFFGSKLSNVTIPNNVTNLGSGAFELSTSLTNVLIGTGISDLRAKVFFGTALKSFTVPGTITNLGTAAFGNCAQLRALTLSTNLTTIGSFAFQNCASLTSLTIPSSVSLFHVGVFLNCINLTNVFFTGAAPGTGNATFQGADNTTVNFPLGAAGWNPPIATWEGRPAVPWDPTSKLLLSLSGGVVTVTKFIGSNNVVNIPASLGGFPIRNIGAFAFAGSGVTSVTIPEGVFTIGDRSFQGCLGLTTLNLPDSLTSIAAGGLEGYSFGSCANLASVTFGTNFSVIGNGVFSGCSSLQSLYFRGAAVPSNPPQNVFSPSTTVYYPVGGNPATWSSTFASATVAPWDPTGNFLVQLNGAAITITGYSGSGGPASIPSQIGGFPVTAIATNAFQNSALTSITIPDSVTSIGDSAFFNCTSLGSVTMGNGVTNIGANAFLQCTALNTVNFGSGVTTIGDRALALCNLLNVFIPANVMSIGASCFSNTPVQGIFFKGNSPTVAGGGGVFSASSATIYYIPGSTGWGAIGSPFAGRPTALWTDLIPSRLVLVGGMLTVSNYVGNGGVVNIPSTVGGYPVRNIGPTAFLGSSITSVTIPDSVMDLASQAFNACTSLTNVMVGNSLTNIGPSAFLNCGFGTIILPASLKTLSASAFSAAVTNIYFKGNAPSLDASSFSGTSATLYYTLGSTGWGSIGSNFGFLPTGLWATEIPCRIQLVSGQVSIDRYLGSGGDVIIPSVIGGYPVTKILAGAFSSDALTSLMIPSSITNIAAGSIVNCLLLSEIYFAGHAPTFGLNAIMGTPATIYYDLGMTGWTGPGVPGLPKGYWSVQVPARLSLLSGNFAVAEYMGAGGAITIPPTIGGLPVTSIGPNAFAGSSITSLTLPDSVTRIESYAFQQCLSLSSVNFGNGLQYIGYGAFAYCPLPSITLPASLNTFADYAFILCGSLERVFFKGNAPTFGVYQNVFSATPSTLYYDPSTTGWGAIGATVSDRPTGLWSVQIPSFLSHTNGTLGVSQYLGSGGPVTIPATIGYPVTSVDAGAFSNCPITSITIPNSVLNVGDYSMTFCTNLTSAVIGHGVTNLGFGAFGNCTTLSSVTIGNSLQTLGNAFAFCSALTNITLPASLTEIGKSEFVLCPSLQSVFFKGNAPTLVGDEPFVATFTGTPATVYYDPSTTGWGAIGATYLGRPTALWSVQVPCLLSYTSGALGIGKYLGTGGAMNIPSAIGAYPVTSIRTNAFVFSAITSLSVPDSIQSIGDYSFYGSSSLTSVTIGNGVTNIGTFAFAYCSALSSVTIGNSLKTIGGSAFTTCTALTSITLPATLTTLGDLAFYNCSSLLSVFFRGNAPALGGSFVFDSTPATAYYLAGRTGWGPTLAGHPAILWNPLLHSSGPGLGVQGNNFVFQITGVANLPIAIEACTNLASPAWQRLHTGTLTGGSVLFTDPSFASNPKRFYRISSP